MTTPLKAPSAPSSARGAIDAQPLVARVASSIDRRLVTPLRERMSATSLPKLAHRLAPALTPVLALFLLFSAMGGTWRIASAAPPTPLASATKLDDEPERPIKKSAKDLTGKLNLNTASAQQLTTLPGVGEKLAARIVEYRQKAGGFKSIQELMNVKGVGERNLERIQPFLSLGEPAAKGSASR